MSLVVSGFSRTSVMLAVTLLVAIVAASSFVIRSRSSLPAPGSDTYEQAARAFYHGLASLEVGLLDDAKREFTSVTTAVPEEAAAWANLGVTHLRLGELDPAAAPIERALLLAPDNADIVLLAGRMEIARGRLDAGLAHLRRAVELNPMSLQARFALADEIERAGAADADAQALAHLDELARVAPRNIAVLVDRARVAAKAGDQQRLNDAITGLKPLATAWPEPALEQFRALQQAVAANDLAMAQRATAFLRNVLARVPAFAEDLSAIRTPTELIAEPVTRFVALMSPPSTPAAPDLALAFAKEAVGEAVPDIRSLQQLVIAPAENGSPQVFAVEFSAIRVLAGPGAGASYRLQPNTDALFKSHTAAVADWNNDFRPDVVVAVGGVQLLIQQSDNRFLNQTPPDATAAACRCRGVWPADIEMDGDLDIIAAPLSGSPFVLRNNGDGSWTSAAMFTGLTGVSDVGWADIDHDNDPDAIFLDTAGDGSTRLQVFANRQAGDFAALAPPALASPAAFAVADIDSDGQFDIVVLEQNGTLRAVTYRGGQAQVRDLASWQTLERGVQARLIAADFDNNGALDILATAGATHLWLGDSSHRLRALDQPILTAGEVFAADDLNSDGRVDLVAIEPVQRFLDPAAPGQPAVPDGSTAPESYQAVRLMNTGTSPYHWKQLRARAQQTAGDQRINSFGVGGYVEVRSGPLFQKHPLTGRAVHIGLGTHSSIDVARIVWPNGIPQAEFGVRVDDGMVAEQRLKGSCPWVFTWDGSRMVFVTDFLWRSPLGLRINAQDTAGVTQTEDWVRLRGDQLVPRGGMYDVRITAELWETHFFDHVSLMAVDHPEGTEVFVDERFSAAAPPALKVHALEGLRPVQRAWDDRGADVTGTVTLVDGKYLSTFNRGRYQGIAEDHFVEVDLTGAGRPDVLVASGWIYPTDSSINVAIAQGRITPRGLSLEAQDDEGNWRVVDPDLGFPAGKNKTVLIDLSRAAGARRLRLRTNLEIYWDALQLGSRAAAAPRMTRIGASTAELRYRGFSRTISPRGDGPETPDYHRIASTSPRWRDLIGYHTRFGDVRELVDRVDDRYVIMNAGDELRLQFAEAPALPRGWRRDFVLIGDGWEKDGDYNTGFSQTVLPLPSHMRPDYGAGTTSLALEDDPVYQRNRDDWRRFHTRYVTPQRFFHGLRSVN